METNYLKVVQEINEKIQSLEISENYFEIGDTQPTGFQAYRHIIQESLSEFDENKKKRLESEYFGQGPLESLMKNPAITEVIVNRFDSIWFEENGRLNQSPDTFYSEQTYGQFLQRLYSDIGAEPTLTTPFIDAAWNGNRVHIVGAYFGEKPWVRLTIRKHRKDSWTLSELENHQWASKTQISQLRQLIENRRNFLVVGQTGSGKTSVLKALLRECQKEERVVVLEDSMEIEPPTESSTHLLTRYDSRSIMPTISLADLVRQSLRMRPDRIVVGEVRGGEAKDLLMALATGHEGSAGTLHASDARQAMIRLEMLIQMGASHWNLHAIRRLIQLSLSHLIVCGRRSTGERYLEGVYRIISVEDSGVIIERDDTT